MWKFEQIPAPVQSMDKPEKKGQKNFNKMEKLGDWNIINGSIDWKKTTDNISTKNAEKLSDDIMQNKETLNQVNQLKKLWKMYEKWKLKDVQKQQYEDLITTIRTELDRDIPNVIEMNKEIDINYFNKNPKIADKEANNIVQNYENINDVQLVNNVVSRSKYLWKDSEQKLNSVISTVISKLNNDAKNVLKMK